MRLVSWLVLVLAMSGGPRWFSFAAYPGARELCAEHVTGNGLHITWRSYATRDAPRKVVAFYERDQGAKAEDDGRGGRTLHARARDDDHVTIIPRAAADQYPSCAEKPKAGEQTVILVSSAARPK